ncbi:hypothetical protein RJ639_001008 [Escallonia herrerae]|uniref:Uncharacterized protein n=1 Tax=Escallonia herrerae TaxID=1293975 RepID=A0AA89BN93_9ASTE|nr:hypothetical protein RJ639_001008 [Escallonia herrerae]
MASSKALQLFMLLTLFATSCIAQSPAAAPKVSPTATPTPSPTVAPPTPSPSPSPVAVPSPSPAPSSPTPSPSPSKTPTPVPSVAPSSPTPAPTVASPPAPPTAPTPADAPAADGPPSGTFADGWVNRAVIAGTALTGTCLAMALIPAAITGYLFSIEPLSGVNFRKWKEHISIILGIMDLDYALWVDAPAALTTESSTEQEATYEK